MQLKQLLIYLILFLTSLICLSSNLINGFVGIDCSHITYFVLAFNGLLGYCNALLPRCQYCQSSALRRSDDFRKILALPFATASIYINEGIVSEDGAAIHLIQIIWMLYLYYSNDHEICADIMDFVVFLNCGGLALLGIFYYNYAILSTGATFATAYWFERHDLKIASIHSDYLAVLMSSMFAMSCLFATQGGLIGLEN